MNERQWQLLALHHRDLWLLLTLSYTVHRCRQISFCAKCTKLSISFSMIKLDTVYLNCMRCEEKIYIHILKYPSENMKTNPKQGEHTGYGAKKAPAELT